MQIDVELDSLGTQLPTSTVGRKTLTPFLLVECANMDTKRMLILKCRLILNLSAGVAKKKFRTDVDRCWRDMGTAPPLLGRQNPSDWRLLTSLTSDQDRPPFLVGKTSRS